jgi:glycosyltransferase involved in cell wall biosynthesis
MLSLIIPCFNEEKNLPLLLKKCEVFEGRSDIEIILVDNGSTDTSANVLQELLPCHPICRSVRVEQNQGYGYGILFGLQAAKGDVLAWTHADMQTDPQDVVRGYEIFKTAGFGSYVKGRRYGRPLADTIFTVGMSFFETVLLKTPLWDINAQPNIFSKEFFSSWVNPPYDFSLDLYVYYLACKKGLRVHRFPVNFEKRVHGSSHWNIDWASKYKFISRTMAFSFELRKRLGK